MKRSWSFILYRLAEKAIPHCVPRRWRLPAHYYLCSIFGKAEVEMRHLAQIPCRRGAAVDVGANVGLYSYAMAKLFAPVHAFEVNASLGEDLRNYRHKSIVLRTVGLSSTDGVGTLHVPIIGGISMSGWGSLEAYTDFDVQGHFEQRVVLCTLDSWNLSDVALLKIDVEGHELEVLKGAVHTIAKSRPAILVEEWGRNQRISEFLADLGYREQSWAELTGVQGSQHVHLFLPISTQGS